MEHGQQDAEPIGTILSGIATLLRELSDQLDIAAARVEDSTGLDARLKKLESWAATAGEDITSLRARVDKVESSEVRTAVTARPTRAERREAAERAELEAAASRTDESATSTGRVSSAPASGTPNPPSTHAPSDQVALVSAKDDEAADTASASVEPDRQKSAAQAPEAPPRLAPIPRLPAPEVAVAPVEPVAAPEKSEQPDAAGSDGPASLGGGTTEVAPGRRLPRANFPRRQPARAESGAGSSLLGGSGRPGKSSPDSGGLLGSDSSLDHGTDAESTAIVAGNALADNAVGGETPRGAEPHDRERDKGVADNDPQTEESIGARGDAGRLRSPAAAQQTGDSAEAVAVVDSAVVDSAVVDSAVVDSAMVDSAIIDGSVVDSAVPSGGSRLPRRAAAYSPSAANDADAGDPATPHIPSRAERRRLAEADAAVSDSAYADSASGSAHAKPESAHPESRHATAGETADRPDVARVEAASTAETAGPAARALGITAAAAPDTAERSRRGAAMSEAAAKQLADNDAPATEVIPGLSALRHLVSDSDDAVEGPSPALPQRGSRRADRRDAVEPGRPEGTPDVGARPHSHGAVVDDENPLPQHGSGHAHRHRDAGSLPERETGDSLPTRHSSGSHAQSDLAGDLPQRNAGADFPHRDSAAGHPVQGSDPDFPHDSDAGLPQRASGTGLAQRDSGPGLPRRDASSGLPQRDSGNPLPQRGTSHALPGREAGRTPAQGEAGKTLAPLGMHSTRLDPEDVPTLREVSGSLPTRDAGTGGTLPRRDPGHAAPPRDAVAEITSDGTAYRSAGRHNSGDDRETEDQLAGAGPRVRLPARTDPSARDDAGSSQSDQGDPRFGGVRPDESPAPDSWQGELDRLAAETAYADDSDLGGDDRQVAPVGPTSLPRRGDGPSGVTRRVEPAGITPRPAPVQPNPFGPPTSSLTAGIDEPASIDMPFDLELPASRPQVSTPEVAEQAPSGKQRPTIEDNAHVDKLQAMLDELKRNPAGPFSRAVNTPPENSGH
ncbi:hypothetical protein [Nocardia shimofusensis]|uniref:hypothetical protein n=1 Tax=Nocardia shimofusensis TaxID=228596 RepID=UPI0008372615|nr:hypothetical protein [Nocardia shimofusensis]